MTASQRREILKRGKPDRPFSGEPQLGAWHTEEEIEAAVKAIRDSMDWRRIHVRGDKPTSSRH